MGSLEPGAPEVRLSGAQPEPKSAVHLLQVLCAAVWGLTFVAGKIAGLQASPLNATLWRFILAGAVLAPLALRAERKAGRGLKSFNWQDFLAMILSGLTGLVLYNYFFIKGLSLVEAGRGSVIVCGSPALIYLASVPLFGTKLSLIRCLGVLLSAAGTAWVVTRGNPAALLEGGLGAGDLLMLGCPLSWTLYSLLGSRVVGRVAPLSANAWSVVAAVLMLLVLVPLGGAPVSEAEGYSFATWGAMAFLGLGGTALGFTLYYLGIRALGAYKAASYINLVPVFGILSGWLILGERPQGSLIAGLVLILLGIRLVQKY
jgi:drug/metabolite transporter (DMT)-like permease